MALERHIRAFEDRAEIVARVAVGELWDRILGEALLEWERLDRRFPPGTPNRAAQIERELEAFLRGLSVKPVEKIGRKAAGVAYNEGRRAAIDSAAEQGRAQLVVRSEILDANTCDTCATLDGTVFEVGTPDYYDFFPPAHCEGGDQCRGFYVMVSDALVG